MCNETASATWFLERFDNVVRDHPDRVAVDAHDVSLTFAALAEQADRLAREIASAGVRLGDVVALRTGPSAWHVVGILAVWRLRAAFLPIDPDAPAARVLEILAESRSRAVIFADSDGPRIQRLSGPPPPLSTPADDLAYVIYTSGSTGRPKGVRIAHTGLVPMLDAQIALFGLEPHARALLTLSAAFDASISDIGTALLSGATLVIPRHPANSRTLPELLRAQAITHADLPPSMLATVDPAAAPHSLRVVVIGGEVCPPDTVRAWASRVRLINVYGPTEATICTSMQICDPRTWDRPLLGTPLPHVEYDLLDGELLIAGPALALGYIDRPDADRARFLDRDGRRWYRTGDLVRRHPDGSWEFLGRLDRQVKIRGRLICPEEIEAALQSIDGVHEAAVVTAPTDTSATLIAHVRLRNPLTPTPTELRHQLAQSLPTWMLPRINIVDTLDRGITGKIDHHALSHPRPRQPTNASTTEFTDPHATKSTTAEHDLLQHNVIDVDPRPPTRHRQPTATNQQTTTASATPNPSDRAVTTPPDHISHVTNPQLPARHTATDDAAINQRPTTTTETATTTPAITNAPGGTGDTPPDYTSHEITHPLGIRHTTQHTATDSAAINQRPTTTTETATTTPAITNAPDSAGDTRPDYASGQTTHQLGVRQATQQIAADCVAINRRTSTTVEASTTASAIPKASDSAGDPLDHTSNEIDHHLAVSNTTWQSTATSRSINQRTTTTTETGLTASGAPNTSDRASADLPDRISGETNRHALLRHTAWQTTADNAALDHRIAVIARSFSAALGLVEVSPDEDFRQLGGDSLSALRVVAEARVRGVDIELTAVLTVGTPAEIARAPREMYRTVDALDGVADRACASIDVPQSHARNGSDWLLTGASGFLGGRLLAELLSHTEATVHCLVRGADEQQARARLGHLARHPRIRVHAGDLGAPFLGLSPRDWSALCEQVGAVLHAAASPSLTLPFGDLAAVTVRGAAEIGRFTRVSGARLHHISSLAVLAATDLDAEILDEQVVPGPDARIYGAYPQTKWAAETVLTRLVPELRVIRPGLLTADSASGAGGTRCPLTAFLRAVAALRCLPDTDEDRWHVNITPVDHAVTAIGTLLREERHTPLVHVAGEHGVSLRRLRSALSCFVTVETVPTDEFLRRAREHLTPDEALALVSASYRLTGTDEHRDADLFLQTGRRFPTEVLRAATGSALPPIEDEILLRYAEFAVHAAGRAQW